MPTIQYKAILIEKLHNLDYAAGYLTACYEEGTEAFLLGIRDVIEAQKDLERFSEKISLKQEIINEMLLNDNNPSLVSVATALDSLDLEITFKPKPQNAEIA
jgi:DNA-binding phage protein